MSPAPRHAIYFAPAFDTPLWQFGCATLGRNALDGMEVQQSPPAGLDAATWHDLTSDPRRYGFHATLKAPFRLQHPRSVDELLAHTHSVAANRTAVDIDRLIVTTIGSFVALTPAVPAAELNALAAHVVEAFEPFRAPLTQSERARRLSVNLTERQIRHLYDWGYPYVFEDFRFHMTLTGPIADAGLRVAVRDELAARYAHDVPIGPVPIDGLCVFLEPDAGQPLRVVDRFRIRGSDA